jgi:integrase
MRFFEEILKLDSEWKSSEYVSVQRWIRRLRRKGSVSTMRAYFKLLAWFVQFCQMNLDDFVRLPKEEVADKVQAFCDKFNDEGKKSSASNAMKALRSFLKANGFRVEELVLEDSYRAMKRPEYVPTKDEVCKMASVCGLKWRATILCLFQSGLRNSTLRALSYGMLKEQIESDVVPIKVHVTGELRKVVPDACKEGVDYWTFFGAEASEALRQYINWRKERYGKIDDDELLFPSESRTKPIEKRLRTPMDQWHLTRIVKKAARRAGIKEWQNIRAHSLRKTFRAVLDAGYIDGGQLAEDDKEYLMGHKLPGAKEPYHNANIDVLAQRYMKLRWAVEGAISKEAKVEAIKAFARSLGIKEIEVKMAAARKAEPNLSEEEALGKIIREELGIAKPDISQKKMSRDPKKVIKEDQLEHYLAQGWDVQTVLPSGKILIRKPT